MRYFSILSTNVEYDSDVTLAIHAQNFNERISIEALKDVYFDNGIIEELQDSFSLCCRYIEGHIHSDKYGYNKPGRDNLNIEIHRFKALRAKIKRMKKITNL